MKKIDYDIKYLERILSQKSIQSISIEGSYTLCINTTKPKGLVKKLDSGFNVSVMESEKNAEIKVCAKDGPTLETIRNYIAKHCLSRSYFGEKYQDPSEN